MTARLLGKVVAHLRQSVGTGERSDAELLEAFIANREESAFEALVIRHGAMVLGVCRRVLRHQQDAEDAFQAAFLVLARKANSVVPRAMVGNWLYGVAYHTALRARSAQARRQARERQVSVMPEPQTDSPVRSADLQPLLDEELSRLPAYYRAAIVLCDLEGKSHQEAARQLGWPIGSLSGRLSRARALLADRLRRRGLGLSASAVALACSSGGVSASVPASLVAGTVKAAVLFAAGQEAATSGVSAHVATLTQGVLQAMFWTKIKTAAAVLLIGILASGAGALWLQAKADKADKADKPAKAAPQKEAPDGKNEFSGTIRAVDATQNTITLDSKFLGQKTFPVARDAKVLVEDGTGNKTGLTASKLADLVAGSQATVKLSEEKQAVVVYVEGPSVQGTLKAVDAKASTVTVAVGAGKGETPAEKSFRVAAEARISIEDGKKVPDKTSKPKGDQLADLPPGALVYLKLSGDQKVVGSISAQGLTVHGTLKAADVNRNTITLLAGNEEKTLVLADGATVYIDSGKGDKSDKAAPQTGKLGDLKIGVTIYARLSLDQKTVVSLRAEGSTISGKLKSVDGVKNTITVTVARKGEEPVDHTIDLAKDVRVRIDDKEGKLTDLPSEANVTVKISADLKAAASIVAEGPAVQGTISAAANNTITVANKGGDDTYQLAASARIVLDGNKEGKLADLIAGTIVRGKLSASKREIIGTLQAEGPTYQGVVKAVDAKGGTITLTIGKKNGGEDKTFQVAKETVIVTEINNVLLKLEQVLAEKEVILRLLVDQKAAARIVIRGE